MSASASLWPKMSTSLKQLEILNLIPFDSPILISPNSLVPKFKANPYFRFKSSLWAALVVGTVPIVALYRLYLLSLQTHKTSIVFPVALEMWKIMCFSFMTRSVSFYQRNSLKVANFYNQILSHERRYTNRNDNPINFEESLIILILKLFPTFLILNCLAFGISGGLLPEAIWNFLPPTASMNQLYHKILQGIHIFVVFRISGNVAYMDAVYSLLIPFYSMHQTIVNFQRSRFKFSKLN